MKKVLLFLILTSFLMSCKTDDFETSQEKNPKEEYSYLIEFFNRDSILWERSSDLPLVLAQKKRNRIETRATQLTFDDYLGRSFKTDYYPFENIQNLGYPIIDIYKIKNSSDSGWATSKPYKISEATSYSYYGFDRYTTTSTIKEKVNKGFSINLGVFKIGSKKSLSQVFTTSITNQTTAVFGQLDAQIKDAVYELQINSNISRKIRLNYIDENFLDDLYNMHPSETFQSYGGFAVTGFITGGKATAVYAGVATVLETATSAERDMEKSIEASFKFDSSSGDVGFGKSHYEGNGSSHTSRLTNLRMSVKTLGGSYGTAGFTIPQSIDAMNVNLSSWAQSLNNKETHNLIDITDGGLYPLSEIVMEANFKEQFENFYERGTEKLTALSEPLLVCGLDITENKGQLDLSYSLQTRFGDRILLFNTHAPVDMEEMVALEAKYMEIFKIKTKAEISIEHRVGPHVSKYFQFTHENHYFPITPYKASESFMQKFIDQENKMAYLLYNENGRKFGYSIYMGSGDFLLDTYGMRDFYNSLPAITIDRNELFNYTLIAL